MAAVLRALRPFQGRQALQLRCRALSGHPLTAAPLTVTPGRACFRNGAPVHRRAAMPAVRDTIVPSELEERIFHTLKAASAGLEPPVVLRCAGGWVRDKLLGIETDSPDIDVALDTMTGEAFGRGLKGHLDAAGGATHLTVIGSNPDQSKHLETANIKASPTQNHS